MRVHCSHGTVRLWRENHARCTGSAMARRHDSRTLAILIASGPDVGTMGRSMRLCPMWLSRGSWPSGRSCSPAAASVELPCVAVALVGAVSGSQAPEPPA